MHGTAFSINLHKHTQSRKMISSFVLMFYFFSKIPISYCFCYLTIPFCPLLHLNESVTLHIMMRVINSLPPGNFVLLFLSAVFFFKINIFETLFQEYD